MQICVLVKVIDQILDGLATAEEALGEISQGLLMDRSSICCGHHEGLNPSPPKCSSGKIFGFKKITI